MTNKAKSFDEGLLDFCTPRQAEFLRAANAHGGISGAAEYLGVHFSTVSKALKSVETKAAGQGFAPDHDWTATVPPGYTVRGVSTLYGSDGEVKGQWVKSQKGGAASQEQLEAALEAIQGVVPAAVRKDRPALCSEKLFHLYPVGDHHIGMLSWHEETGEDYDTTIAERLLLEALDGLVEGSRPGSVGVLALMGDFLHYDSYETVTPTNKHQLDADTRYPRLVATAMRVVRFGIERLLDKHETVHVVVCAGNHDPVSMCWLREALAVLYEKEPRVHVDRSPGAFHYFTKGNCLLAFHHGDKTKTSQLPMVVANDRAQEWGATTYRYGFVGHVHHDSVKDFPGIRIESLRILPPLDAYAHMAGYRSGRDMKRIDYHVEHGEVGRQIWTPSMLD